MDEREAIRKALAANPEMAKLFRDMLEQGRLKAPDPNDTEPLMIVCKRWPGLVDGCRMALCTFCGEAVALAPSSQEIIARSPAVARYCCMECMADGKLDDLRDEPTEPKPLTP